MTSDPSSSPQWFSLCGHSSEVVAHKLRPSFPDWPCCSHLNRPLAGRNSVVHDGNGDSVFLGNFSPRATIWRHLDNASVSGLSHLIGPRAVGWAIPKIIVKPLDCQSFFVPGRNGPGIKRLKNKPLIAHINPLSSVIAIGFVAAPGEHVFPALMKFGSGHSVCCGALFERGPRALAATRQTLTRSKIRAKHRLHRATSTNALPHCAAARCIAVLFQHSPKAKTSTFDVY